MFHVVIKYRAASSQTPLSEAYDNLIQLSHVFAARQDQLAFLACRFSLHFRAGSGQPGWFNEYH